MTTLKVIGKAVGDLTEKLAVRRQDELMDDRTRVEEICGRTVHCELCFKDGRLARALVDIPQPRWVGPRYFDVVPRILVVMLNPSSGKRYAKKSNPTYLRHLESYRSGKLTLKELFDHQKDDLPRWGRGRFWKFYMARLGLILEETAFAKKPWWEEEKLKPTRELIAELRRAGAPNPVPPVGQPASPSAG